MRAEPHAQANRLGLAVLAAAVTLAAGNVTLPRAADRGFGAAGIYCDSCPDPVVYVFGVEFRHNDLWAMGYDATLTRLSNCQPVEVFSVQGFRGVASGLAWDRRRDLFVLADAKLDMLEVIDLHGNVLREFPTPGTGPIGVAYDSTRDVYWITDFETHSLDALDATTGTSIASFHLTRAVRIAGAAYDAVHDAIVYEDRILDAKGYLVSCTSGAVLDSFPLPFAGNNGWEDNTFAPNGSLWIHARDLGKTYCIDRSVTPTRRKTWGGLKLLYRR
jgi:hypothetical protein